MNEALRDVWARLTERWNGLSSNQRRNLVIAIVAVLAALSIVVWLVGRPNYVTVMTGLDNKSLGQVQTQLQTLKIPNEIQGDSILVPSKDANTARVQLAMAGLPNGSGYIGYSGVKNSIAMTSDQFNLQVLDALQQSLNATIQSIDGIEGAQVHIVMPATQVFVSSSATDSAKASVFVQLAPGVQLSNAQVAGIQQLVAHSVKGLTTGNVTVVDQNGVTLSGASGQVGTLAGSSSELAMRQQMAQSEEQQLLSELSPIVGAGNVTVVVHANVTFNQVKVQSKSIQAAPGGNTGYPTNTQKITNSTTSGSTAAGGVAGQSSTNPNLPTYVSPSGQNSNTNSSSSEVTTTYAYPTTTTTSVQDPIQINGYTVGVFLNANDKTITPAVVSEVKSFVQNAVGTNLSSAVSVSAVPFSGAISPTFTTSRNNLLLYGVIGVGVILLGLAGLLIVRRRRANQAAEDGVLNLQLPTIDDIDNLPLREDEQMRDQLVKLASQKPDEFANLLRTWLAE